METDVFLRALLLDLPLPLSFKPSLFPLPLLLRLRDEIAVTAMSSSIQSAAQRFGLQEDLVMETIHDFAGEDTEFKSAGNTAPAASSSLSSESRPAELSIRRKLKCVRSFCQSVNQSEYAAKVNIPLHQLLRWKEKIHKVLFQDEHAGHMTSVKPVFQDVFLKEAEELVYKWYQKKRERIQHPSEAIRMKAARLAKVDDLTPNVTKKWVSNFMSRRKIPQGREVIDCDKD